MRYATLMAGILLLLTTAAILCLLLGVFVLGRAVLTAGLRILLAVLPAAFPEPAAEW